MSPATVDAEHQQQRAESAAVTARAARQLWAQTDPAELDRSWAALLPRVVALVTAGQLHAARQADPYLSRVLLGEDAAGQVNAERLSGVDGGGRPLGGLLQYPVFVALNRVARGFSLAWSIASGAAFLDLLTRTLIADAGRAADLAGMIARPRVTSYVRAVELPACARCIVLAGREYALSEGFARHPRCQCTLAPHRRGDPVPVMPEDLYAQMSPAQRRRAFGKDAVAALAEGADIAQVVNARRGMSTGTYYGRTVQTTSEGTTRRGLYGRRRSTFARADGVQSGQSARPPSRAVSPRLMPAEIYRLAKGDREHAIRLLRKNGYIV